MALFLDQIKINFHGKEAIKNCRRIWEQGLFIFTHTQKGWLGSGCYCTFSFWKYDQNGRKQIDTMKNMETWKVTSGRSFPETFLFPIHRGLYFPLNVEESNQGSFDIVQRTDLNIRYRVGRGGGGSDSTPQDLQVPLFPRPSPAPQSRFTLSQSFSISWKGSHRHSHRCWNSL